MAKKCDNTSVAIIVRGGPEILMIESKKYNFGFALPAGHCDGLSPEETAIKESSEEVGFAPSKMEKIYTATLPNACSREGGTHHGWHVFDVPEWSGELKIEPTEVKKAEWKDKNEIATLAKRLEDFVFGYDLLLTFNDLPEVVRKTNEDEAWKKSPGLEPPMYFIFKALGLI